MMLPGREVKPKLVQRFLTLLPQIIVVSKCVILCNIVGEKLMYIATTCLIINRVPVFRYSFLNSILIMETLDLNSWKISGQSLLSFTFYLIGSNLSNKILIWKIQ